LFSHVYIGFFPSFIKASFIPGLPPPRGGVTGRLLFNEGVLVFFSDGFKIYFEKNKNNSSYFMNKYKRYFFLLLENYT